MVFTIPFRELEIEECLRSSGGRQLAPESAAPMWFPTSHSMRLFTEFGSNVSNQNGYQKDPHTTWGRTLRSTQAAKRRKE